MLRLEKMSCGYGLMRAVHALDLEVAKGRTTALLGANGAGKSSTIMCIAGHVRVQEGRVVYNGEEISRLSAMARVKRGISLAPEGRRLFASLTVNENLIVGGYTLPKERTRDSREKVLGIFPRLGERLGQLAGSLSGGEQQMLSIARALMAEPQLLMIDELSLGLMPKVIDICYEAIGELKKSGLTILLVEQSTQRALEVADDVLVLESGRKVWEGATEDARDNRGVIDALLGMKGSEDEATPSS
ncbi:MAG: ABC transporter ATP-binding protein [Desulfosarcinaceae bacterium]|jgi:branched-chain amino acid transport system ATP-binding protein